MERSQHDWDDLVESVPNLPAWVEGTKQPTHKQLQHFAQRTGTAVGYFFLPEPPDEQLPIPDLRTVGNQQVSRPSANLLDTIYDCQQRQAWYQDYAIRVGIDPPGCPGSIDRSTPPIDAAQIIRDALSFSLNDRGANWTEALRQLRERAEQAGVLVMISTVVRSNTRRKLDVSEFRGFALTDSLAPLVFVNGSDTLAAQIFTLAHEIAHIWLGESGLSDVDMTVRHHCEVESWCNRVAAELLVPIEVLRTYYTSDADKVAHLGYLARHFKSSELVVLKRLYDAQLLEWGDYRQQYLAALDRAIARPTSGAKGGNFYHTLRYRVGAPFVGAVVSDTLEGNTPYTDAVDMLGVKQFSTFYTLADRLGTT